MVTNTLMRSVIYGMKCHGCNYLVRILRHQNNRYAWICVYVCQNNDLLAFHVIELVNEIIKVLQYNNATPLCMYIDSVVCESLNTLTLIHTPLRIPNSLHIHELMKIVSCESMPPTIGVGVLSCVER